MFQDWPAQLGKAYIGRSPAYKPPNIRRFRLLCPGDIRQALFLSQFPASPTPTLQCCQLRPSYDHSTNSTPLRYKQPLLRSAISLRPAQATRNSNTHTIFIRLMFFTLLMYIKHDDIRQAASSPSFLAIQRPFDTRVSYGPATITRHIRHLSDTNRLSSDTKSVELSNPPAIWLHHTSPPGFLSHATTESVQPSHPFERRHHPGIADHLQPSQRPGVTVPLAA